MVDSTPSKNLVNQHIVAAQNHIRISRAANLWWSNMLAVVKLRQKGTTMVSKLPRGVFRHMLEYDFPNELSFRYSEALIENRNQDRHFPAITKLSYDNYLVAVNELPDSCEYQFTLADGANCGSGVSWNNWTSLQIS